MLREAVRTAGLDCPRDASLVLLGSPPPSPSSRRGEARTAPGRLTLLTEHRPDAGDDDTVRSVTMADQSTDAGDKELFGLRRILAPQTPRSATT